MAKVKAVKCWPAVQNGSLSLAALL